MLNSRRVNSLSFIASPGGRDWSQPKPQCSDSGVSRSDCGAGHHFGNARAIRDLATSVLLVAASLIFVGCQGETKPQGVGPTATLPAASATPAKPTAPVSPSRGVTIAAASDLKFALEEVMTEFRKLHPDIDCRVTFGSSGNFFSQLSNKAPFDMYLSADIDYPRKLIDEGLAIREAEFQYAIGHLVLWVPRDSPLKVEETGIETLKDASVSKIAVANPKHAPYGRAAIAALKSLGVHDQVEGRLVTAENIAQTAQFVETGAADIGLISLSLALSPALRDKGRYWAIPESSHSPIVQGGVIMNWVQDLPAADQVRSYLLSPEGRAILKKYGFTEPPK